MAIKPNPPPIRWLESPLRDLQDHRRLPDHIALQALVLLQARHRVSGADRARPHHSGPGTSASSLPPSRDFDCLLKSYNILRLDFRPRQMVLTRCCRSASPIGSFIFLGPTGVGKTFLAHSLAEFMFGDARVV